MATTPICGMATSIKQMTSSLGVLLALLLWLPLDHVQAQDQRYCGRKLADILDLVCAGRGFNFKKRSEDVLPKLPVWTKKASEQDFASTFLLHLMDSEQLALQGSGVRVARSASQGQSVVAECCRQSCSIDTLRTYCALPDDFSVGTEQDLANFLAASNRQYFTPAPVPMTTTRVVADQEPDLPSAEIMRGSANRHNSYFWLATDARPTRTPLLVHQSQSSMD